MFSIFLHTLECINTYKRNSFRGWFFKQSNANQTLIFIPSIHTDGRGARRAYLQLITDDFSHCFHLSGESFTLKEDPFVIHIGKSVFTKDGIILDIQDDIYRITGKLLYGNITPIKGDFMGPLKYAPFLRCKHGVISMRHEVNGKISINGTEFEFVNGTGYMENESGTTFPRKYLWTQCNTEEDISLSISVATIDTCIGSVKGAAAVVIHKGKEYRIASYYGARILLFSNKEAIIKQGSYLLTAKQISFNPQAVNAPIKGKMTFTVWENPSCRVQYAFYENNKPLFCFESERASFEFSNRRTEAKHLLF